MTRHARSASTRVCASAMSFATRVSRPQWPSTSEISAASSRRARTTARGGATVVRGRALWTDKEPVALPRHGADETRPAPVVLELHPQVADVTVDQVALRDVVRAPERVEDRLPGERLPGVRREQVQQRLFYRGEMQDRRPRLHTLVKEIELEAADLDDGDEGHGHAVRAPHQRQRARDQLFWAHGHGDEIVGAVLVRGELCLEVAAFGKHDRRERPPADDLAEERGRVAGFEVDVEDQQVRLEVTLESRRLREGRR